MIPSDRIIALTREYEARGPIPESEIVRKAVAKVELDQIRKLPFYTLCELLERPKEVFFSHNGMLEIGLPFEDVARLLKLHPSPEEIEVGVLGGGPFRSISVEKYGSEWAYLRDVNRNLHPTNIELDFFSTFLGISSDTFSCSLVNPAYGLRADRNGSLGDFMAYLVKERVPALLHTADLKESEKGKADPPRAYVVNGILQ